MSDLVGVDIEGVDAVQKMLAQIDNPQVARAVTKDVATYVQGQMRKYPPYTYVSRTRAYGKPFQTKRQRNWFFWALRTGQLRLPYQRTQKLKRGWKVLAFGATDHIVANDVSYAKHVQNSPQARMMTLMQWRSVQRVIREDADAIRRQAQEAFNRALKKIRG